MKFIHQRTGSDGGFRIVVRQVSCGSPIRYHRAPDVFDGSGGDGRTVGTMAIGVTYIPGSAQQEV
jgi:hypothetical protein